MSEALAGGQHVSEDDAGGLELDILSPSQALPGHTASEEATIDTKIDQPTGGHPDAGMATTVIPPLRRIAQPC